MIAAGMVGLGGAAPINIWVSKSGRKNPAMVFMAARNVGVTVSVNY